MASTGHLTDYRLLTLLITPVRLMHQSMLNPRVGGLASTGHLTEFPYPWVGNNKRFDVTQDPEGGGNFTRFCNSLGPNLSLASQSSLGLLFQEVAWCPCVFIACSLLNTRRSQVESTDRNIYDQSKILVSRVA